MDALATRGRATCAEAALHIIASPFEGGSLACASLVCVFLNDGWQQRLPGCALCFSQHKPSAEGLLVPTTPLRSREEPELTVRLLVQAVSCLYARAG